MLAAVLVALLPSVPVGSTTWPQDPEKIDCKLVLSIDRFLEDRWYHSAGELGVGVPESPRVVKKQYFAAYVFFTHYTPDEKGSARIRFDIRVAKPDGTTYFAEKDLAAFSGRVDDFEGVLLTRTILHVCFEPEDALGEYAVEVSVRDDNNGTSDSAKSAIELVEYEAGDEFESGEDLFEWVRGYRKSPDPRRMIPAFLACGKPDSWKDGGSFPSSRGFFREAFENNAWLFPHLLSDWSEQDADVRREILRLLSRCSWDSKDFVAKLEGADREAWRQVSKESRTDPLEEPIDGRDALNELWGIYHASGKFDPVRRLCDALAPDETGAVEDSTLHEPKSGIDVPLRTVVRGIVRGSIVEGVESDPLLKSYCEWILASDTTAKTVRDELRKVLEP